MLQSEASVLVDILRAFLLADQSMRRIFARYREGVLTFDEVQRLVGDDERSVLFRLKERCHALFRGSDHAPGIAMQREALFDLAVGSLFHEAMKFRENLYQRTVYGPKVRALRSQSGAEADGIFEEFEKILAAAAVRLDEALHETEALLVHTRAQFRALLAAHPENVLVARFLVEGRALVEEVLGDELDDVLASIHGTAVLGYARAARSYLESGFFAPARRALAEALARDPGRADLLPLAAYAEGMDRYVEGEHRAAVTCLTEWVDAESAAAEPGLSNLAYAAVCGIAQRAREASGGECDPALATSATALAERLQPLAPHARAAKSG
ncbi:MAG TPA: hypothetical protein VK714_22205 [Myxococcota bacterium]|nr:hypothetical protein [Myxococcota bacterium]